MKNKKITFYFLAASLGVLSIILPTLFIPHIKHYDAPLFPTIRTGLEGVSTWSFGLLLSSGFSLKIFSNISSWKLGLATMILFPIISILEIIADSSSHNLLPFEFIFYAVYSIPAIIGAYIAEGIKMVLK